MIIAPPPDVPAIIEPVRRRRIVRRLRHVTVPVTKDVRTYTVIEQDGRFILIPFATFEERWHGER